MSEQLNEKQEATEEEIQQLDLNRMMASIRKMILDLNEESEDGIDLGHMAVALTASAADVIAARSADIALSEEDAIELLFPLVTKMADRVITSRLEYMKIVEKMENHA